MERKRKLLVVDDSDINRGILCGLLKDAYELREAADGRQALDLLSKQLFDAMLLDIMMPVMDGFGVLSEMRRRGLAQGMPVIVISADVSPDYMGRAYQLGVSDYIGKPFDTELIWRRTDNLIRLREAESAIARAAERQDFFDSVRHEIRFTYYAGADRLELNRYGAEKLRLPRVLDGAFAGPLAGFAASETGLDLADVVRASFPGGPVLERDFQLDGPEGRRWMRLSCRARWAPGRPPRYDGAEGIAVDVHEIREHLRALEHKSSHDGLTGLLNHPSAREAIQARLDADPDGNFILLLIDMDEFKQANDRYGHLFGDKVLSTFADLLRGAVRKGDIVARMGGDEFLAFLEYSSDPDTLVGRVYRAMQGRCGDFEIRASMGAAYACRAGYSYDGLFEAADGALYAAKDAGRGRYAVWTAPYRAAAARA